MNYKIHNTQNIRACIQNDLNMYFVLYVITSISFHKTLSVWSTLSLDHVKRFMKANTW